MARAPIEASAAAAAQASATSDETAASAPRTGHVQHVCRLLEQYLDNTSRGVHLLAVAVAEFAQSTDAAVINAEEFATEAVAGEGGGEGEGERQDLRYCLSNGPPLTMRGGDAAEVLASALCLAPRRVANSLGPAAPLALSPAAFYPVVCKAAVHATVRCLGASTAHDADPGAYAGTGFAGDVWRAFSGRLLSAGRASDLAEAWLQVMVEEGVGAGRGGREGDRKSGEKVKKETTHEKAVTASVSAATAWEDWVDGPSGSEVHSRMVVRLPASWRKPFTEALLRALWPYSSYEPRRQGLRPRSCNSTRALEGGEPWEEHWPEGFQAAACRVLVGRPLFPLFQPTVTSRIEEGGGLKVNAASAAMNQRQEGESGERYKIPVGIVEELVLQRPLPPPAAEAIADTLAWCDRRRISQIMTTTTSKSDSNAGSKKDGSRGRLGEGLLVGALKRVAAVWAEPSFLNQSPPRQQEFYTRFLLAALRSGGIGGENIVSGDPEVLPLLIRGVGARLDVATRETRLHGMRVGEAVAALSGQELRFAELDAERREEGENPPGSQHPGRRANASPAKAGDVQEVQAAGGVAASAASTLGEKHKNRDGGRGLGRSGGVSITGGGGDYVQDEEGEERLDPLGTLPLISTESPWIADGGNGEDGLDEEDDLEAYDLWDEEEDLAAVAEPVYLDQLIELLRSQDEPDTPDKHETALKCAAALVRRRPPDLPHRAAELSRDLLYLGNAFDLEGFDKMRGEAMIATVTAAPETCALYLGSEMWGTGASEGTKLEILDVLVQAASELAGWTTPVVAARGGKDSRLGGIYPSALMRESRGTTHRSTRLLQQQRRRFSLDAAAAEGGAVVSTVAPGGTEEDGNQRKRETVTPRTRRWGYRRGPREEPRRNLFGKVAPVFFYPLVQGMVARLRQAVATPPLGESPRRLPLELGNIVPREFASDIEKDDASNQQQPPPTPLFSARLLHALTCLVELCGNCPATPFLAADLLALAWLLKGPAAQSRELRRAVLIAVATGVERSPDGVATGALQGHAGELLRWLQACTAGADGQSRELAVAVLGHSSVQALAYL
ncbi:unnamed protein product [Ascophyllum nodosum]